ncbi:MAG: hypothetical protein R3A10_01080 [Caldilineaceae bacterium]
MTSSNRKPTFLTGCPRGDRSLCSSRRRSPCSAEIRRQRIFRQRLDGGPTAWPCSCSGLHLYVRTLPPTPTPIPTPQDAESAWWGLWPVTYALPPGQSGVALAVIAAIAGVVA